MLPITNKVDIQQNRLSSSPVMMHAYKQNTKKPQSFNDNNHLVVNPVAGF